jgi:hypothetical protein
VLGRWEGLRITPTGFGDSSLRCGQQLPSASNSPAVCPCQSCGPCSSTLTPSGSCISTLSTAHQYALCPAAPAHAAACCAVLCCVPVQDTYPIAFQLAGKASDFYSVQYKPLQALSRPGGKHTTRLSHAGKGENVEIGWPVQNSCSPVVCLLMAVLTRCVSSREHRSMCMEHY